MGNDNSLSISARLDEKKSEKIIRQQLANIQKRLQKQSQIRINIKINEGDLEKQAQKLGRSLDHEKMTPKQKVPEKTDSVKERSTIGP